jgi:DNA-binding CsgD family transcriptional regulator
VIGQGERTQDEARAMKRPSFATLLAYGTTAGVMLLCFNLISLSPLAFDWGRELMAGAVALAGVAVGVLIYRRRPADAAKADEQTGSAREPESQPDGKLVAAPANSAASDPAEALSMREREVLTLLAEGLSNKALARRLNLSENTIKTHLANIYEKLGVAGRVQAVLAARRLGAAVVAPDAHPKFTRPGDGSTAAP